MLSDFKLTADCTLYLVSKRRKRSSLTLTPVPYGRAPPAAGAWWHIPCSELAGVEGRVTIKEDAADGKMDVPTPQAPVVGESSEDADIVAPLGHAMDGGGADSVILSYHDNRCAPAVLVF